MKVTVPLPLPSKTNSYEIRFNDTFWKQIAATAGALKRWVKGPLYWIGPSKVVKDTQLAIAFIAKTSLDHDTLGPVRVEMWIADALDVDNAAKIVLDGIQASGRIKNDRQVKQLTVWKEKRKNLEFSFELTEISPVPCALAGQGEESGVEEGDR